MATTTIVIWTVVMGKWVGCLDAGSEVAMVAVGSEAKSKGMLC